MTDESHDPNAADSTGAPGGGEPPLEGWGSKAEEQTWMQIAAGASESESEGDAPEPGPATSAGRSKRPTAYGLPPVTERTSDLRSSIDDSLTTKAPSPLSRLSAAAAGAAHAVSSAASSAANAAANAASGSSGEEAAPDAGAEPKTPRTRPKLKVPPPPDIDKLKTLSSERPEVVIGLAFIGGLLLATILKRLARR